MSSVPATTSPPDWGFLLDKLCAGVAGITHALALSSDGLKVAWSRELGIDDADQMSAYACGMESLNRSIAVLVGGGAVEQTVVEMTGGYVVLMTIGNAATLVVTAAKDCNIGHVGYEMAQLINSAGDTLVPDPRRLLPQPS